MPWAVEIYCPSCERDSQFLGPKIEPPDKRPLCGHCATFMELRTREMTKDGSRGWWTPVPLGEEST